MFSLYRKFYILQWIITLAQLPPEHDELPIHIYLSSVWFWLNTIYRSSSVYTVSYPLGHSYVVKENSFIC